MTADWLAPLALVVVAVMACHDAWADEPPMCDRPDGPGLCYGPAELGDEARTAADLVEARRLLNAERDLSASRAAALSVAIEQAQAAQAEAARVRAARWRWVTAGAVGGAGVLLGGALLVRQVSR